MRTLLQSHAEHGDYSMSLHISLTYRHMKKTHFQDMISTDTGVYFKYFILVIIIMQTILY